MPTPTQPNIVMKEVSHPKITLTKDRFEVKVPLNTTPTMLQRITLFSKKVASELGDTSLSLRGNIHLSSSDKLTVQMKKDSKEVVGEFFE